MQRLEVSGAVRPIYGSLGVKRLIYGLLAFLEKKCTGNINETVITNYKEVLH